MINSKTLYFWFIMFVGIASCQDPGNNNRGGLITSELSLNYINIKNYQDQSNFLVVNVRYVNQSKQSLYLYYPSVVIDTANTTSGIADINDGFINLDAIKTDTLLKSDAKITLVKTFCHQQSKRNQIFEMEFKKKGNYPRVRKRLFGRLVFLKPGEQMEKSFFFKNVFARRDYSLKTDTLLFKTDNWLGAGDEFFNSLPKTFNGFKLYEHKIVSDSLTIIRKGFDPIKFQDILL